MGPEADRRYSDDEGGTTMSSNFTTGAVLSWALPIAVVFCVLVWWMATLAIRALRSPRDSA